MKQERNQCMPFDADFVSTKHTILKQQDYIHHWLHGFTKTSDALFSDASAQNKHKTGQNFDIDDHDVAYINICFDKTIMS